MKNYEGNSGYVEAQTHAPILPSDISAIRIGSSQVSPDQLFKKHGDSLLAFIRTALSKNIKVIGDFSPKFLEAAESASININKGLSEGIKGISKSANEPVEAIGEVAYKTVKATEVYPVDKQSVRGNPNLFAGNNLNPEIKKILDFAIKPDAEINKILGQPEITALDKLQDKSLIHKKLLEKINSLLPKGLESQFGINLNNSQLLGSGSFSSVVGTTDSRNLSYKVLEGKSIPTPIKMKINDGILKEPPEVSILKKLSSTGIVPAFNLFENNLLITEQITGKTFKQIISTIARMNISQEAYIGVIKTLYEASGSLLKTLHQYDVTHGDFNN